MARHFGWLRLGQLHKLAAVAVCWGLSFGFLRTPHTPNREPFKAERKQFCEDTDVYIRLMDLQFVSPEIADHGPVAVIRIAPQAITNSDKQLPYSEFRTRRAMLPLGRPASSIW